MTKLYGEAALAYAKQRRQQLYFRDQAVDAAAAARLVDDPLLAGGVSCEQEPAGEAPVPRTGIVSANSIMQGTRRVQLAGGFPEENR